MNFMERVFIYLFIFVLLISSVFAADDWSDVNNGSLEDNQLNGQQNVGNNVTSLGSDSLYTSEFYVAMGLIILTFLIVGIFFWLWMHGSKNKWEK